jgi:hypothetical protein
MNLCSGIKEPNEATHKSMNGCSVDSLRSIREYEEHSRDQKIARCSLVSDDVVCCLRNHASIPRMTVEGWVSYIDGPGSKLVH